jgi:hypothetical protein
MQRSKELFAVPVFSKDRNTSNLGKTKVDQLQCKEDEKRCTVCLLIKKTGEFHKDKRFYKGRYPSCAECRNGQDTNRVARMRQHRGKKQQLMEEEKKYYVVMYDPDEIYSRGAQFSKYDFEMSLRGSVWPIGMIVKMKNRHVYYRVRERGLERISYAQFSESYAAGVGQC